MVSLHFLEKENWNVKPLAVGDRLIHIIFINLQINYLSKDQEKNGFGPKKTQNKAAMAGFSPEIPNLNSDSCVSQLQGSRGGKRKPLCPPDCWCRPCAAVTMTPAPCVLCRRPSAEEPDPANTKHYDEEWQYCKWAPAKVLDGNRRWSVGTAPARYGSSSGTDW